MVHSLHAHSRRHSDFLRIFVQEMFHAAVCLTFALLFLAALYAGFRLLENRALP